MLSVSFDKCINLCSKKLLLRYVTLAFPRQVPSFFSSVKLLQEGGLKLGSCLTLGNELSEETHVLTKQEILLGKGTLVESRRGREPRRTALPCGSQSPALW